MHLQSASACEAVRNSISHEDKSFERFRTSSASKRSTASTASTSVASPLTENCSPATLIYDAKTLSSASVDERQFSSGPLAPKRAFSLLVKGPMFGANGHLDCVEGEDVI